MTQQATKSAAIIGGGVIGGGWAARFLLMGWNVQVFDPDPEAQRKISEVIDNARRSLPGLSDVALPEEGELSFHDTMSEAVAGVTWIQESVPERLELKRKVYQTLQEHCPVDAIIGSSTSGFKPSELQGCATRPEQIVVTHPFNPVYLLPLIELVPTAQNSPEFIAQAKEILTEIGMFPLHVRAEIDAHIADRFLEAVWREALWLIKDGIATTEEIDNAIRYGFGLRWAQMGLFETYRIAGGEAGMRHFIEQFGPCLEWPWTKLMDVPELDDVLLEKIVSQSDDQAGTATIRELEALRDDCLVSVFQALRGNNYGAGKVLADYERELFGRGPVPVLDPLAPSVSHEMIIPADWTDYNGHTNDSRYSQLASEASDTFFRAIGFTPEYLATGRTFYTVEGHTRYLDQTHSGDKIKVLTRVASYDEKRIHLWSEVVRDDGVVAFTAEHIFLHVDTNTGKSSPMGSEMMTKLKPIGDAHLKLPQPVGIGRRVGEKPAK